MTRQCRGAGRLALSGAFLGETRLAAGPMLARREDGEKWAFAPPPRQLPRRITQPRPGATASHPRPAPPHRPTALLVAVAAAASCAPGLPPAQGQPLRLSLAAAPSSTTTLARAGGGSIVQETYCFAIGAGASAGAAGSCGEAGSRLASLALSTGAQPSPPPSPPAAHACMR